MYTQLDCTKEQKHSSAFGSPLSIPSAAELWLILVSSPASPLSTLLSHLPLSTHNIYIFLSPSLSHTGENLTLPQQRVSATDTHARTGNLLPSNSRLRQMKAYQRR